MATLHDVYRRMNSLEFRMEVAGERTARIGCIIAQQQHAAAGMDDEPMTRAGRRAYQERLRYWRKQMRERGWPDGFGDA